MPHKCGHLLSEFDPFPLLSAYSKSQRFPILGGTYLPQWIPEPGRFGQSWMAELAGRWLSVSV